MPYVPSEERRQHFIDAARRIIQEEGLAKATTRRIADAAGAPLGSLHYCFRNKEELFEAVSQRFGDEGLAIAASNITPGMGAVKAAGEILRTLARWISETQNAQVGEFEFLSWAMRSEQNKEIPRRVYTRWVNGLRDIMQAASTGTDGDLDLDLLARAMLALTDGFNLQDRLLSESRITDNMEAIIAGLTAAIDHGAYRRSV
ncbi:TetR/AcrR family transcriptional regulator [Mycolicibacterium confluentis]|uniref:Uncharacterized protein n=1 Tax=Mycolicibacterium confluentis TaxID=28047 RepID=A0A7I7XWK0_9MYCO|nr:TetR/AcrR family transcriptional regulator [Mycolicibacterium confluentis]MCV7321888.1 TetR/AcrR family transcriptional regulator [Mycolicibacterium confluentis]ORV32143.1 hypothetical protein AWB99_10830 [Mycolicibacterium confluentis]BBZ33705.1 hypothetical protein MCNF_23100 [Mycolicibacterium confluentis]